jgi:hypothetical protein
MAGGRAVAAPHVGYQAWRPRGINADRSRRMAPATTKRISRPRAPAGTINTTD